MKEAAPQDPLNEEAWAQAALEGLEDVAAGRVLDEAALKAALKVVPKPPKEALGKNYADFYNYKNRV